MYDGSALKTRWLIQKRDCSAKRISPNPCSIKVYWLLAIFNCIQLIYPISPKSEGWAMCNILRLKALCLISCLLSSLTFSSAHADVELLKKIAKADIAYGEYLAGECVTCHKKEGTSSGIPVIAGINAKTFVEKITGYRNKTLKNKVMQMVARGLDEEQTISLALYFSSLK